MAAQATDQEFLEFIAKSVVSNPDAISVERTVDEMGVLLTLKTDPADMGYIIGRKGQTAQAIRTLLKIVGAKNNARVNLKIYDPEGGNHRSNMSSETPVNREEVDTSAIDDLN